MASDVATDDPAADCEAKRGGCPVPGCHAAAARVPMCGRHWAMLPVGVKRGLRQLSTAKSSPSTAAAAAYQVGLLLAAEAIDARAPAWATGWSGQNVRKRATQRRDNELGQQRRDTCERIRADMRKRRAGEYEAATEAWKVKLVEIQRALDGSYTALDVALAMIRGGHGTEGYCPFLVAAALDLDEQHEPAGTPAQQARQEAWECNRFDFASP